MTEAVGRTPTYRHLLRTPGVSRVVATAAIAGIAALARPVALVIFARERTGSFSSAGLVLAGLTAGTMLSAPLRGRQLDRHGYARPLVSLAITSAAATVMLVIAGRADVPAVVLALFALVAGMTNPPVGAALRSLWRELLGDSADLRPAYALVTMLNEISFFAGPLMAGIVIGAASATAGLLTVAGMLLGGTVLFALAPASRAFRPQGQPERLGSPLRFSGVQTLLLTAVGFGAVFGVLDVALPAFAVEHGSSGGGGILLASLSPGIVLGGYLYGRRAGEHRPGHEYARLCLLGAVGLVPLLVGDSILVMASLVAITGAAFAPVTTCQWALVDVVSPPGSAVETTTWLTSTYLVGSVVGAVAAGLMTEHGSPQQAFVAATVAACAASVFAFARRRTLLHSPSPS
jgi:predicted MFS family arabinose efflux permease